LEETNVISNYVILIYKSKFLKAKTTSGQTE